MPQTILLRPFENNDQIMKTNVKNIKNLKDF